MITIIDYKAGNLTSVKLAFEYIGVEVEITDEPAKILKASRVVFPGVGAARSAMANLKQANLVDVINQVVADGVPFLGICIGMQLLFDHSQEDGGTECMGILPGVVKKFEPSNPADKIPQMGWNAVDIVKKHPVFSGIENQSEFYFVHSYYPWPGLSEHIIGKTEYADVEFASSAGRDNLVATQFHPEKSGNVGLQLLKNFSEWDGQC